MDPNGDVEGAVMDGKMEEGWEGGVGWREGVKLRLLCDRGKLH